MSRLHCLSHAHRTHVWVCALTLVRATMVSEKCTLYKKRGKLNVMTDKRVITGF